MELVQTDVVDVVDGNLGVDPGWLLLVCCGENDGEEAAVPFPRSGGVVGDHGDDLVELQASAMESLSVVVGVERWRGELGLREMAAAAGGREES